MKKPSSILQTALQKGRLLYERMVGKRNLAKKPLKIMIVSTPKTGNTWLRSLISVIYGLPVANLDLPFDLKQAEQLGDRWVSHQHYGTTPPDFFNWASKNKVFFITTIRHPGDVLVSLVHYVRSYAKEKHFWQEAIIAEDPQPFGEKTLQFVQSQFSHYLDISLQWMKTGKSRVVRYEDLCDSPREVLLALTKSIESVPLEQIDRAIAACDINALRNRAGNDGKFFRQGGSGHWRKELPAAFIKALATHEPYPEQFRALGYTLDAANTSQPAANNQ